MSNSSLPEHNVQDPETDPRKRTPRLNLVAGIHLDRQPEGAGSMNMQSGRKEVAEMGRQAGLQSRGGWQLRREHGKHTHADPSEGGAACEVNL